MKKNITYLQARSFKLKNDYIELIKLIKLLGIASSGSEAKYLVDEGLVKLNGEIEYRKRAKIRAGDIIIAEDIKITIE